MQIGREMMGEMRQKMPEQLPSERVKNFDEVALGYTEENALLEANRCVQCKNAACVPGCPVGIDIPGFIRLLRDKNYSGSLSLIREKNNLPAICGRVCPQESQCEKACILSKAGKPVAIGRLERFVADNGGGDFAPSGSSANSNSNKKSQKVAVVGAGPAGLTAAADLARMGYSVTIFEALHEPGGVLTYGIPEFRLPKKIVKADVDYVKSLGVDLETNFIIGKTMKIDELVEEFDAVFIGTGAGTPYFMGIPGENLNGVLSANEFLTRSNLMKAYLFPEYDTPIKAGGKVVVIGGGNVAMDAARTALRLGSKGESEVTIAYRRTENEMPARAEEREHAKEEGVKFMTLTAPVKIVGTADGWVSGIECVRMELGEPDASGRRRPMPVNGSEFLMDADQIIVAIGQGPNPILKIDGVQTNKYGNIITEPDGRTSREGIFAGGDITPGDATVINAMGDAKKAALAIDRYLSGKPKME